MEKRFREHGFLMWSFITPPLGGLGGYLLTHTFVPNLEKWGMGIGFLVGCMMAMWIGSRRGAYHFFLLGLVGATVMCFVSGMTSEYINPTLIVIGALVGLLVGILVSNRRIIAGKFRAVKARNRSK